MRVDFREYKVCQSRYLHRANVCLTLWQSNLRDERRTFPGCFLRLLSLLYKYENMLNTTQCLKSDKNHLLFRLFKVYLWLQLDIGLQANIRDTITQDIDTWPTSLILGGLRTCFCCWPSPSGFETISCNLGFFSSLLARRRFTSLGLIVTAIPSFPLILVVTGLTMIWGLSLVSDWMLVKGESSTRSFLAGRRLACLGSSFVDLLHAFSPVLSFKRGRLTEETSDLLAFEASSSAGASLTSSLRFLIFGSWSAGEPAWQWSLVQRSQRLQGEDRTNHAY